MRQIVLNCNTPARGVTMPVGLRGRIGLDSNLESDSEIRSSGGFKIHAHATTQRRRDVDQRVERETRDPAAEQIVDPWLGDDAPACGFGLCPFVLFQPCHDLLHQFSPRSQIRGLLGSVCDRIPNTRVALGLVHTIAVFSLELVANPSFIIIRVP